MSNLWEWLLQTLSVTLVAALLLLIKRMLEDKLSPRWQYGVWVILALRILLPVHVQRTTLLPLPLWMEALKSSVEARLASAYAAPYVPLSLHHVLPIPHGAPQSISDWLFVLLTAGMILCALWYLLSYLRLRLMLRRGTPVRTEIRKQIEAVCAEYDLKSCRVVEVKGLHSAFVCGILRPMLAIPADSAVDDKILLHELLHLKYRDAWQNVFWCILRCLHWFNPLMHIVINRIENDMESLCDQRVLERLVGEERRVYGNILLSMANDRFARAPGSSSISNGGKNIARRIAAIVRFKKYPRGMTLVSVCIVLVLLCPTLLGSAHAAGTDAYTPDHDELAQAMALSRIRRCTTVAGAIDTYAKGLMCENGIYIATASPLNRQQALTETMRQNRGTYHYAWHLDGGAELENVDVSRGYELYELTEQADGSYTAYLLFAVNGVDESLLDISEYNDEREAAFGCCVILPIRVFFESGWVVEEYAARSVLAVRPDQSQYTYHDSLPFRRQLSAETEHGTVTVSYRTYYYVNNQSTATVSFPGWSNTSFDTSIKPNAAFEMMHVWYFIDYTCIPDAAGNYPTENVSLKSAELESADEKVDFPRVSLEGNTQGSSSGGYTWMNKMIHDGWDGTLWHGSGTDYYNIKNFSPVFPGAFWVQIYWDGEVVEELILEEVAS